MDQNHIIREDEDIIVTVQIKLKFRGYYEAGMRLGDLLERLDNHAEVAAQDLGENAGHAYVSHAITTNGDEPT